MTCAPANFSAISIGCSSGGLNALSQFLPAFPAQFPVPIVIVQHRAADADNFALEFLDNLCQLAVKEAEEKEIMEPGTIYFAPVDYHLLIEAGGYFSLSCDAKVCHSRPSINVLFQSAADAFADKLIGVVLTGANDDGSDGVYYIKARGGLTIAQDPVTSEVDTMPRAAINSGAIDRVVQLPRLYSTICEAAGL